MLTTVLKIIELSLQITLELMRDLTPEQRAAIAQRHDERMAFWQKLVERVKD